MRTKFLHLIFCRRILIDINIELKTIDEKFFFVRCLYEIEHDFEIK